MNLKREDINRQIKNTQSKDVASVAQSQNLENVHSELSECQLRTILRQRDVFIALMMHDLKNPLIGSNIVLEAMIGGNHTSEKQLEYFELLIASNKQMLRMIWNLLDTFKHQSGTLIPVFAKTNLEPMLNACLQDFFYQMSNKKQKCAIEISETLPEAEVDIFLIKRVMTNLIENAIKFTPDSGSITVRCQSEDDWLCLSVEDSGRGVPYAQRELLFKQVAQGMYGTGNEIGTGLGLYLSKHIVDQHDGKLEYRSSEKGGAIFSVTLPKKRPI